MSFKVLITAMLAILLNDLYACEQLMKVNIIQKENLSYSTSETSMERINEVYNIGAPSSQISNLVNEIVCKTSSLVDHKYLPKEINIQIENEALVKGPNYEEMIPSSLILSLQVPQKNTIVLGMLEMNGDSKALESVLAHEVGHMLVEWIARDTGHTSKEESALQFWSKPIYEGVADFAAACITNSTVIGSHGIWFNRNILEYDTLNDSQNPSLSMDKMIENSFIELDLIPRYKFYANWLRTIKMYLTDAGIKDPYSEGTWVAGSLWKMSNNCNTTTTNV